jgi:hypothetical protein
MSLAHQLTDETHGLEFLHFLRRKLNWDAADLPPQRAGGATYHSRVAHSFRPGDHPCRAVLNCSPNFQRRRAHFGDSAVVRQSARCDGRSFDY